MRSESVGWACGGSRLTIECPSKTHPTGSLREAPLPASGEQIGV
jgi:hypothetical protein